MLQQSSDKLAGLYLSPSMGNRLLQELEMSTNRGGPREGAGRKPLGEEPMMRHQVMLDAKTVDKLKALGGGNLSEGIRLAAKRIRVKVEV
jgi:hypothetical protein